MFQLEYDDFKKTLGDLCVAVNRPFTDDLARVFWDDLKRVSLSDVRQRATYLRACGKTKFTSSDLKPEPEPPKPANTFQPPDHSFDDFHRFGQRCLLKFILSSKHDVAPEALRDLVEIKNRLVSDFRAMHRETQDVTADQMREAMLTAFGRTAA